MGAEKKPLTIFYTCPFLLRSNPLLCSGFACLRSIARILLRTIDNELILRYKTQNKPITH